MMFLLILLVIGAGIIFYGIGIYNSLVRKRTMVEEAWSGIDVLLKKRYDLIPNLLATVKGYAKHEQETLDRVISARNSAMNCSGAAEKSAAEGSLNLAISGLMAVSEAYPDLKANTNFLQLQGELSQIEGEIEKSRRYYNGTVRESNIMVETFPSNFFAKKYNFLLFDFFEIEQQEKAVPKVEF